MDGEVQGRPDLLSNATNVEGRESIEVGHIEDWEKLAFSRDPYGDSCARGIIMQLHDELATKRDSYYSRVSIGSKKHKGKDSNQ